MMFVEGQRPIKEIYIDFKYYGTCKDSKSKMWTWYSSSDLQVNSFQNKKMFGMKLLTKSGNKSFYVAQRFKNLLPKNDTENI